jgi:hypothetical protein
MRQHGGGIDDGDRPVVTLGAHRLHGAHSCEGGADDNDRPVF